MTTMRVPAMLLMLLYGLSGVLALSYEVLWTRMLSLLFGASVFGVVITVAAFMLGLGMGSLLGVRLRLSGIYCVLLLAVIEGLVAAFALCLPDMMPWLQAPLMHVTDLAVWQVLQAIFVFSLLTLPALALGMGFPLVIRAGRGLGLPLSLIYGVNTVGGALGGLMPLWLLPWLGWSGALQLVATAGLLLAAMLVLLGRVLQADDPQQSSDAGAMTEQVAVRPAWPGLLMYALVGASALMLEMVWTRAFGMVLLRTEYVLGVILAVFLLGMGIGSLLSRYLSSQMALQWIPALAAITSLSGLYVLPWISDFMSDWQASSLSGGLLVQSMWIALCTLPAVLSFGAWLPLLERSFSHTGHSGAWYYGMNSIGACLGALLAGFVLMPWLGTAATWVLAAVLVLLAGVYWALQRKWLLGVLPVLLLLSLPVLELPPASRLLASSLPGAHDLMLEEDALNITHVMEQADGQRLLLADLHRMDASTEPTAVAVQQNQVRLPMLLQGDPKHVLLLGLGTGISASATLAWPQADVVAVELSGGAIRAAGEFFDLANHDVVRHIKVVRDDARRYLMQSDQRFDVIVGDLFHPDMVGRGALLSQEHFSRAREHLSDHGVFTQWLALNQFDRASLQAVLRAFAAVFPDNALFVDGYRLALVGMQSGVPASASVLQGLMALPVENRAMATGGEGGLTWLGRYWGPVSVLLGDAAGPVQQEWRPVIEFALPGMRYAGAGPDALLQWLLHQRVSMQTAMQDLAIGDAVREQFERAYVATSLNMRAWQATLQQRPDTMRVQMIAYRSNPADRWAGFAMADAMFASLDRLPKHISRQQALEKVLSIRPDHEQALRAMLPLTTGAAYDAVKEKLRAISPYGRMRP